MNAWAELVALAERELELLAAERWDEAAALGADRAGRVAVLAPPTAQDRPQLERLLALQTEISARLAAARGLLVREIAGLRRGASAVRGYRYAATTAPAPSRVDGLG
jgi:hypothetical protein